MKALKSFNQIKGIRRFCDKCTNLVKVLMNNKESNKEVTKAVESIAELKNEIFDFKAKSNYTSQEKNLAFIS